MTSFKNSLVAAAISVASILTPSTQSYAQPPISPSVQSPISFDKEEYNKRFESVLREETEHPEPYEPAFGILKKTQKIKPETLDSTYNSWKNPGHVIILGESHTDPKMKDLESKIISSIGKDRPVMVGLELVPKEYQADLTKVVSKKTDVGPFLDSINSKVEIEGRNENISLYQPLIEAVQSSRGGSEVVALMTEDSANYLEREKQTALTVASFLERNPQGVVVLPYGRSHLTHGRVDEVIRTSLVKKGIRPQITSVVFINDQDRDLMKNLESQSGEDDWSKGVLTRSYNTQVEHIHYAINSTSKCYPLSPKPVK